MTSHAPAVEGLGAAVSSAAPADRLATPELRRRVFDALADAPRNTVSLEGGLMPVDLGCLPSSRPKRRAT